MRQLFFSSLVVLALVLGAAVPVIAASGYIWVDLATPQREVFPFFRELPLSSFFAILAFGSYLIADRCDPPRRFGMLVLLFLFAGWITFTTVTSVFPLPAWEKWDWAVKSVIFAIFIPLVFRTPLRIELFLLVMSFSVAVHYLSGGVTAMLGKGYGRQFTEGNSGLQESSTLATVCVMLIPINIFLMRNSVIIKQAKIRYIIFSALIVFQILTVIGTFARTGLVALAVLFLTQLRFWPAARWRMIVVAIILAGALTPVMSDAWTQRMSTINTFEEDSSAMSRIEVWKWTIGYVQDNPMGGGFGVYRLNSIELISGKIQKSRAFHNMYIEVLGEHGYPGLIMFLALFMLSFRKLRKIRNAAGKNPDHKFFVELSSTFTSSLIIYMAGAMFIGVAFQPFTYYLIGLTIGLENYYFFRLQPKVAEQKITAPLAGYRKAASA